jgi:hypothetical protein
MTNLFRALTFFGCFAVPALAQNYIIEDIRIPDSTAGS